MIRRIWIRKISQILPHSAGILRHGGGFAAAVCYSRFAFLALALTMIGCGAGSSSSTTATVGLQSPPEAGPFNTYVGTSPFDAYVYGSSLVDSYSGYGLWTASFDHSTSSFNVLDVTTGRNNTDDTGNTQNVAGSFSTVSGFLALTQTNDPTNQDPYNNDAPPPAGFAFEIPGRVAILRQGDSTIPVTALVPAGCPSINGNTKFNFVALPTPASAINSTLPWDQVNDSAYGSVVIATSGASWHLTSFEQSTLSGIAGPNNGVALPAGTCAPTAVGTTAWIPSDPTLALPKTVAVGPSGFYLADLGETNSGGYPGEFGVIQPSASLKTSDVLSSKYLGFIFEPGQDCGAGCLSITNPIPESQLAAFTASAQAGSLVGGAFPLDAFGNDDPTQPAATNLSIVLGTQDATSNGVYGAASITNANTGTTYPAVAVVGNPEDKYAIFIIAYDQDNSLPLGIYLFQQ
jgi:hypothetical protein